MLDFGRELLQESKVGNYAKVKELVKVGAPYTADWLGTTPLYYAVYYNYVEIVKLLLQTGVALDVKNKVDRTPLHVACQMGHVEVVKLLLAFNADVNAKDMLKMSTLHWAVESGNPEVVKLVLNHGCPLYCIDKFGKSATDIAEDKGDYHIARLIQDARDMTSGQRNAIVKATRKLSQTYAKTVRCKREETPYKLLLKKKKVAIIMDEETTANGMNPKVTEAVLPEALVEKFRPIKIKEEPVSPPPNTNGINHKTVRLLEAHGIRMLEPDTGTVVSSAVASGQSVRLTEAGKLALISSKPERTTTIPLLNSKNFIQISKGQPGHIIKPNARNLIGISKEKPGHTLKPATSPKGLPLNLLGNGKKIIKVKADELIKMATQKKFVIKTPLPANSAKPIPRARYFEGKLYTNLDQYIEVLKLRRTDCEKNISELEKLLERKRAELNKLCYLIETTIKEKSAGN